MDSGYRRNNERGCRGEDAQCARYSGMPYRRNSDRGSTAQVAGLHAISRNGLTARGRRGQCICVDPFEHEDMCEIFGWPNTFSLTQSATSGHLAELVVETCGVSKPAFDDEVWTRIGLVRHASVLTESRIPWHTTTPLKLACCTPKPA